MHSDSEIMSYVKCKVENNMEPCWNIKKPVMIRKYRIYLLKCEIFCILNTNKQIT